MKGVQDKGIDHLSLLAHRFGLRPIEESHWRQASRCLVVSGRC